MNDPDLMMVTLANEWLIMLLDELFDAQLNDCYDGDFYDFDLEYLRELYETGESPYDIASFLLDGQ